MYFPKYWAKADSNGVLCWGFSDESKEAAAKKALEKAKRLEQRLASGDLKKLAYEYGSSPLREALLNSLDGGVIVRNRYGSEVLCTESLMFVDIDLKEESAPGFMGRLFGKKQSVSPETSALEQIERWTKMNPRYGFRIYRTKAGLRLLATAQAISPQDSERVQTELSADPLYIRLCKNQKCFRARLTPKPWRIGIENPPSQFPFETDGERANFENWLAKYERTGLNFSTAKFVNHLGSRERLEVHEPLIALMMKELGRHQPCLLHKAIYEIAPYAHRLTLFV